MGHFESSTTDSALSLDFGIFSPSPASRIRGNRELVLLGLFGYHNTIMAFHHHKQTAYFSPLASSDPDEGRSAGYSSYSPDYSSIHATSPGPSPGLPRESQEMLFSPCGFSPDALQTKPSFPPRGGQKMLARDFFLPSQAWMLLAKFSARFVRYSLGES